MANHIYHTYGSYGYWYLFLYQYFTGNQSEAFKISWFCGCRNDSFLYGFRLGRSNLLQRWDGKGKFGASEQGPTGYLVHESCVRGNKFASGESYKKLRNITTLEGKSTVNGLLEVAICQCTTGGQLVSSGLSMTHSGNPFPHPTSVVGCVDGPLPPKSLF